MEWAEALVPAMLVALAIFISTGVGVLLWCRYRRERQDRSLAMTSIIASCPVNLALTLPLQVRGLARHGDHAVAIETDGGRVVPREAGTVVV
jgi:hypothetical protein